MIGWLMTVSPFFPQETLRAGTGKVSRALPVIRGERRRGKRVETEEQRQGIGDLRLRELFAAEIHFITIAFADILLQSAYRLQVGGAAEMRAERGNGGGIANGRNGLLQTFPVNFPRFVFGERFAADAQPVVPEREQVTRAKKSHVREAHAIGMPGAELFRFVFEIVGEVTEEPAGPGGVKVFQPCEGVAGGALQHFHGVCGQQCFSARAGEPVIVVVQKTANVEPVAPAQHLLFECAYIFNRKTV